jgi:hypothetical protein
MVSIIISFVIGYLLWKVLPGKITAAPHKIRTYIDMGAQILGIIIMLSSVIKLIKYILL